MLTVSRGAARPASLVGGRTARALFAKIIAALRAAVATPWPLTTVKNGLPPVIYS